MLTTNTHHHDSMIPMSGAADDEDGELMDSDADADMTDEDEGAEDLGVEDDEGAE